MNYPITDYGSRCSIYEKDGYVTIVEEIDQTDKSAIVISWKVILFIVCLFMGINTIRAKISKSHEQAAPITSVQTVQEPVSVSKTESVNVPDSNGYQNPADSGIASYFETGIIFPDSSSRILSTEEIAPLDYWPPDAEDYLYQYAINEIYARNGFSFSTPYWANYFSRYSWYQNRGYSEEQAWDRFNSIERNNVEMLKNKRKEVRGY